METLAFTSLPIKSNNTSIGFMYVLGTDRTSPSELVPQNVTVTMSPTSYLCQIPPSLLISSTFSESSLMVVSGTVGIMPEKCSQPYTCGNTKMGSSSSLSCGSLTNMYHGNRGVYGPVLLFFVLILGQYDSNPLTTNS